MFSKRVKRISLAGALAVGGLVAWALPPAARTVEPDSFPGPQAAAATTLRGAFHVHSRWSDGSGTVDEIAAAAAAAGLDFVILTDHGDGTISRPPSYRGGVLVVQAVEISTDAGHYVALGLPAAPYPLGGDARGVVRDVDRLGGFGVIAHPSSPRDTLAWTDWSVPVEGIEFLNGDSQWRDDGLLDLLRTALGYPLRPAASLASLLARPEQALARWDALAARRQVVGLGAADAHARLALGGGDEGYGGSIGLRFPGYEQVFRAFAIRVELDRPLRGDAVADAVAVIRQLRAGRTFTAIDALASPVRFSFTARTADGGIVRMGERAPPGRDLTLRVALAAPAGTTIELLAHGRTVTRGTGRTLDQRVSRHDPPAAYRVEVTLADGPGTPPMPWIVSNPIYVGVPEGAAAAPAGRGSPFPLPGDSWQVERREDATAALGESDDGLRLALRLGDSPATYVAAVRRFPSGALTGLGTLRFDVHATRPLRASVQLRQSREGLDPRWRRSFFAGPARRAVAVPLEEFAPAWPAVPAQPDLAAVDSLLLVVDTINTRPGTSGVLTVENLGLERRQDR